MSKNVKKRRQHCPSFHFSPLEIANGHFQCKTITHMVCYTYNIFPGDGPMWNCTCMQLWRDSRLTWSHPHDSDVEALRVSANRIWTPDIRLYNESVSRHNAGVSAVF